MSSNEQKLEETLSARDDARKAAGVEVPIRLTPEHIDAQILKALFWHVPDTTTIFCALVLKNGAVVTGSSACIAKENFNAKIGRSIAHENARREIWQLEGYAVLSKQQLT